MADKERPIDAELLTTNIAQIAKNCARSDAQKALIGRILFMIENMPAIEAEPAKHGEWIEKKVFRMKWIPYADDDVKPDDVGVECMTEQKCSYCKRWTIKFTYHIELDYCPLCGARMDGDSDDQP